ncbi:hypothetical protein BJY01DRAFT_101416 [Aspergillus pseudoustus]|uniref:Uncharacterized protein n=1 Tax=Aspergillus pseudoustus TaxID=1810923 RepID=A0ABR4IYE9_9EURO
MACHTPVAPFLATSFVARASRRPVLCGLDPLIETSGRLCWCSDVMRWECEGSLMHLTARYSILLLIHYVNDPRVAGPPQRLIGEFKILSRSLGSSGENNLGHSPGIPISRANQRNEITSSTYSPRSGYVRDAAQSWSRGTTARRLKYLNATLFAFAP